MNYGEIGNRNEKGPGRKICIFVHGTKMTKAVVQELINTKKDLFSLQT